MNIVVTPAARGARCVAMNLGDIFAFPLDPTIFSISLTCLVVGYFNNFESPRGKVLSVIS